MTEDLIAGLAVETVAGPVLCRSERRVRGRVRVTRAEQVPAVVAEAAERGWPVHAISSGKNWGMGSYLPKQDDRLLLDLSGLKGIGPLDRSAGSVRIEAGVTQQELYDWLQREAPEFAFNVTGAAAATSIVGNAMERGIGYDGSRADEVFGHEVVLPDGCIHKPDAAWFHRTGVESVGPNFDPLWAQSEWAVVTALWLKLRRKQEVEAAVIISGEFEPVLDLLQRSYRTGVLRLPTHLGGDERALDVSRGLLSNLKNREVSLEETQRVFPMVKGHTAIAALRGTRRMVRAAVGELRRLNQGRNRIQVVTARKLDLGERILRLLRWTSKADFIAAARPLLELTWGVPSDAGMVGIRTVKGVAVDDQFEGVIYFNALSSIELKQTQRIEALVRNRFPEASITRVIERERALAHICTITFPPDNAGMVHDALEALGEELRVAGFPPYRLGVANSRRWSARLERADKLIARLANRTDQSVPAV